MPYNLWSLLKHDSLARCTADHVQTVAGFFLGLPLFNEGRIRHSGIKISTSDMLTLTGLIMAFVHTFAQDNPAAKAQIVVISVDAKFLPAAMVFINFVMRGPSSALVSIAGIVASHFFDFLTRIWPNFGGGRNWLETPQLLKRWCGDEAGGVRQKAYGTAFTPGSRDATSSGSSSTSWRQRGVGRRLGS